MKSSRKGAKVAKDAKKKRPVVQMPPARVAGGAGAPAAAAAPRASRPNIPGYGIAAENEGKGLLPWRWAEERLSGGWNYWLATTRPDGRPHVMLVWGLWWQRAFYFSTGEKTVKARNLAANPHCAVCTERADDAVILEGTAEWVPGSAALGPIWQAYQKKYDWDVKGSGFFVVRPRVAFGLIEKDKLFTETATRWTFDGSAGGKQ
jgi:hypothetical protein